jgi:hypothetical protein
MFRFAQHNRRKKANCNALKHASLGWETVAPWTLALNARSICRVSNVAKGYLQIEILILIFDQVV